MTDESAFIDECKLLEFMVNESFSKFTNGQVFIVCMKAIENIIKNNDDPKSFTEKIIRHLSSFAEDLSTET